MAEEQPTDEWIEAANCLATVAHQLSSAVHEANNLLQVIAGSAEMLQLKAGTPEDVLKRAAVIADHAHRVSALLGGVRELAKFPPRRDGDTTDLQAVVQHATTLRKHAASRAHIAIALEPGGAPLAARVSWRPALQVILNLMLNAEQAVAGCPNAVVSVTLRRDGADAVVTVSDNGPGLPASTERFALAVGQDLPPRLGLGLSAARWLATREAGSLDVRSLGNGTVAVLRLPAAD